VYYVCAAPGVGCA
jgi:magnesium-transporting ATPase (P-type)